MPLTVLKGADGVHFHPPLYLTILYYTNMKQIIELTVNFDLEFEAPILVKVKAHWRLINGKKVKVRSHYRRIWVCR